MRDLAHSSPDLFYATNCQLSPPPHFLDVLGGASDSSSRQMSYGYSEKHSHLSSVFPLGAKMRIKSADNIFKHWAKGHSAELCLQDEKVTESVSQDTEDFPMQTHLGHCKQRCKILLRVHVSVRVCVRACMYLGSARRDASVINLGFESWSSRFNTLKS